MDARITAHQNLSADLLKMTLRYEQPQPHISGQYSVLSLPGVAGQGYYSIASPASAQPDMTFLIRIGDSALDQAFAKLKVGDLVTAQPPSGKFQLSEKGDSLIFVAGGTGIAPMLAMLLQSVENGDPRPKRLLYGLRSEAETGFESQLASLRDAGVQIDLILGEPVQLDSTIPPSAAVYACGPKGMLEALKIQAQTLSLRPLLVEPY
jgi:ferredoxin-NADP reductase